MNTQQTKLFISYSRSDRQRIEQLYDALSEQDELHVFRDTEDILPTEEWQPRLEKLIRESDTIIFALSPQSVVSHVCAWELELANSLNKRIIPVVVEQVDGNVPDIVSKLNYIFLTETDDLSRVLPKIQSAISQDIDWIREHTRLGELADRWDRAVRLGAQPLRGRELNAAEAWLVEQPRQAPAPTQLQRRFILASRQAATRRQRLTVLGAVAALVVVGVLGAFAWVQRGAAIKGERKANEALLTTINATQTMFFEVSKRLGDAGSPIDLRIDILSSLMDLQKDIATNFPDDNLVQRSRAIALTDMAALQTTKGETSAHEKALEMNRQALAISESILAREPDKHYWKRDVLLSNRRIAINLRNAGRMEDALIHINRSVEMADELVRTSGQPVQDSYELQIARNIRSGIFLALLRVNSAIEDAQVAIETGVKLLEEDRFGTDPDIKWGIQRHNVAEELVIAYRNLARAVYENANLRSEKKAAIEELRKAEKVIADERNRPGNTKDLREAESGLQGDLVWMQNSLGQGSDVIDLARERVAHDRAALALSPQDQHLRKNLAITLQNLSELAFGQEKDDLLNEAVQQIDLVLSLSPEDTNALTIKGNILFSQCSTYAVRENWDSAIDTCNQNAQVLEPFLSGEEVEGLRLTVRNYETLGLLYYRTGENGKATDVLQAGWTAAATVVERFPGDPNDVLRFLTMLSHIIDADPENRRAYASGAIDMATVAVEVWPDEQVFRQLLATFEQILK